MAARQNWISATEILISEEQDQTAATQNSIFATAVPIPAV
jgi:hypothetical protein